MVCGPASCNKFASVALYAAYRPGGLEEMMERFRVCPPDTLQLLHEDSVPDPSVSSTIKVVSYRQGAADTGNFTVSKYPDGTIVLDDGKNKVIQRPHNHPKRRAAKFAQMLQAWKFFLTDLLGVFRKTAH
ncbi:MAG TPA: hypothetical protein V6C97_19390 [Oculatellaceae cyanobacterium]